jgi:ABC-type glycerol-3-phosphate transport system substrate-binding protein
MQKSALLVVGLLVVAAGLPACSQKNSNVATPVATSSASSAVKASASPQKKVIFVVQKNGKEIPCKGIFLDFEKSETTHFDGIVVIHDKITQCVAPSTLGEVKNIEYSTLPDIGKKDVDSTAQ